MQRTQPETFAAFVTRKCKEHNTTMLAHANFLSLSSSHLYDVEQGPQNPLKEENKETMAAFFELDEKETALIFDIAGIDRGIVPPNFPDYILQRLCAGGVAQCKEKFISNYICQVLFDTIEGLENVILA